MRNRLASLLCTLAMGVGVMTAPAFATAAPAPQAVCVAHQIDMAHDLFGGGRGFAENAVLPDARDGGAGEYIGPRASNDDCA